MKVFYPSKLSFILSGGFLLIDHDFFLFLIASSILFLFVIIYERVIEGPVCPIRSLMVPILTLLDMRSVAN